MLGPTARIPADTVAPLRRKLIRLAALVLMAALYRPLNKRPHQRVLSVPIDRRLPMVPPLAVPYLAFLPIYWFTVLRAFAKDREFEQLATTATIVYGVSNLTYLVYQTHMPRPTEIPGVPGASLVRLVYSHDNPYCDFPSEHASSAMMFVLHLRATGSPFLVAGGALSTLVLAATLLLKQHTIIGTAGGATLAPVVWAAVARARR